MPGRILSMGILSLNLIPLSSLTFATIFFSSSFNMSSVIEYCLSITPKPYESAPIPKDISVEEIEAQAAAEESYAEAMAKHAAWKEVKIAAEREDKLRLACEVQAANIEALKQKAEKKRKAEEKRKEEQQKVEEK